MDKLADGLYVQDDGTLHIDAAELCIANGYEPTAANQAQLEAAARQVFGAIEVHDDGKDPRVTED